MAYQSLCPQISKIPISSLSFVFNYFIDKLHVFYLFCPRVDLFVRLNLLAKMAQSAKIHVMKRGTSAYAPHFTTEHIVKS